MSDLKLSDQEIFDLISEIISGFKYHKFKDIVYRFQQPPGTDKVYASFYENQKLAEYTAQGFVSELDLSDDLRSEFFSTEDEDKLKDLQVKITAYKNLLNKRKPGTDLYTKDQEKLKELELQKDVLLARKNMVKEFTSEFKAREEKFLYLAARNIRDSGGNLLWETSEEFQDSFNNESDLFQLLNDFLNFYFGLPTPKLRQIARSYQWKNYYISSTRGLINLFGNSSQDLSLDQLNLMAWSNFYADIQEMDPRDRPDESLLEDDERLDSYLKEFTRKQKAEAKLSKNAIGGGSKVDDHQHVIVTAESEKFVPLHKQGLYSDTEIISGRAKDSVKYSEKEERAKIARRRAIEGMRKGK